MVWCSEAVAVATSRHLALCLCHALSVWHNQDALARQGCERLDSDEVGDTQTSKSRETCPQETSKPIRPWLHGMRRAPEDLSCKQMLLPPVILQARRENLPKPLATLGRDLGLILQFALPVHETCVTDAQGTSRMFSV